MGTEAGIPFLHQQLDPQRTPWTNLISLSEPNLWRFGSHLKGPNTLKLQGDWSVLYAGWPITFQCMVRIMFWIVRTVWGQMSCNMITPVTSKLAACIFWFLAWLSHPPGRWRWYIPSKCRADCRLCGVIIRKTLFIMHTAIRIYDHWFLIFFMHATHDAFLILLDLTLFLPPLKRLQTIIFQFTSTVRNLHPPVYEFIMT